MRRRTKRTLGVVILVGGVATTAVAVAATLGSWGTTQTTVTVHRPASATSAAAPVAPTQTPEQFLQALAAALREGNVDFLAATLNPAVIARYGEAQCRATLATTEDGSAQFAVKQVGVPTRWTWNVDGKAITIRDAIPVDVDQVTKGVPRGIVVHLAPAGGQLTWFVDCGDPVGP